MEENLIPWESSTWWQVRFQVLPQSLGQNLIRLKLWQKGTAAHEKVDSFTVGKDREYDLVLAQYDCEASMAHAKMLGAIGLITTAEAQQLCKVLEALKEDAEKGVFTIENEFEDMHSKIEHVLTEKLGDLGKKIHTARSRNDQVLVAMHLYLKQESSYAQYTKQISQLETLLGVSVERYLLDWIGNEISIAQLRKNLDYNKKENAVGLS